MPNLESYNNIVTKSDEDQLQVFFKLQYQKIFGNVRM